MSSQEKYLQRHNLTTSEHYKFIEILSKFIQTYNVFVILSPGFPNTKK